MQTLKILLWKTQSFLLLNLWESIILVSLCVWNKVTFPKSYFLFLHSLNGRAELIYVFKYHETEFGRTTVGCLRIHETKFILAWSLKTEKKNKMLFSQQIRQKKKSEKFHGRYGLLSKEQCGRREIKLRNPAIGLYNEIMQSAFL